jgi:xanthine dehydrogenase YagS FAD-binding subunit
MQRFELANPTTTAQAVSLLGDKWGEVEVLAGGTDLLSLMKDFIVTPKRVVNLKGIKALGGISSTPAGLRIGALATFEELQDSVIVRRSYPALRLAAAGVTSPQIRAMGTVGGDLCQRPRCWYFRGGYGLLGKDQSGKSLVVNGDNRYHAIFGNDGPAYFVNPSSLAPVLVSLGAKIRIHGPRGERTIAAEDFFLTPKSDSEREHALAPNEVLTEVIVPAPGSTKCTIYEVRQKEALDWPLAVACVALTLNGKTVRSARITLGHVAPVPWRARAAEEAIMGKAISEETVALISEAAVKDARPMSGNAYKVQLARVAVKRAILETAG